MFRILYVGALGIAMSFWLMGCDLNQPTSPPIQTTNSIQFEIRNLDSVIKSRRGTLCADAFDVIVTDSTGIPLPGIYVNAEVISGPGYVYTLQKETDTTGVVRELFFAKSPVVDSFVTIRVSVGQDTALTKVFLPGAVTR